MKRLALVASFCGITITQMMAQNINGEQISDTTLFDKFSKELGEVVVKAHRPQYKKTHEGLLTNVAGTVLSKMGTAEDVLKHVPSIVKKKDGYEVVGKGTPISTAGRCKTSVSWITSNLPTSRVWKSSRIQELPTMLR